MNYVTKFSIYNPDDYKRCVCWFWGDGEIDCPQKRVDRCTWSSPPTVTSHVTVPIFRDDATIAVTVAQMTKTLVSPTCSIRSPWSPIPDSRRRLESTKVDFIAFELIEDNQGRDKTDVGFRAEFTNARDYMLK